MGTAVLFGLAPALQASRHEPQAALKEGGATTGGRRGRRIAGGLVMAQLALALLLLAGAGLLIKTVVRSMRFDPGFDTARVLQGDVSLPALRYATPAAVNTFATALMEQLERIPGTRAGAPGLHLLPRLRRAGATPDRRGDRRGARRGVAELLLRDHARVLPRARRADAARARVRRGRTAATS